MSGERFNIIVKPDKSGNATIFSYNGNERFGPKFAVGNIFWNGMGYAVEALATAYGDPERTHVVGDSETFEEAVEAVARHFGPVRVSR